MRTQKQIAASRENGCKSGDPLGPATTLDGKARFPNANHAALKELEPLAARDRDAVRQPRPRLARNPFTGNPVTNPWESP